MDIVKKSVVILAATVLLTGCFRDDSARVINKGSNHYGRYGVAKYAVVKEGQSLQSLSKQHRVPLEELIRANGLYPPYKLAVGQKLYIPAGRYHNVKDGETIAVIAHSYKVRSEDIIALNGLRPGREVRTGQRIRVPTANYVTPSMEGMQEVRVASTKSQPQKGTLGTLRSEKKIATRRLEPLQQPKQQPKKQVAQVEPKQEKTQQIARVETKTLTPSNLSNLERRSDFTVSHPLASSKFEWPVHGKVLSRYGRSGSKFHEGLNIAAPLGSPVASAGDGKVIYVGNELEGYGNLVIVKHKNNLMTAYAHAKEILVKRGAKVRKGQSIATVGKSGNVKTPQLHFSVRKGKKTINPEARV